MAGAVGQGTRGHAARSEQRWDPVRAGERSWLAGGTGDQGQLGDDGS